MSLYTYMAYGLSISSEILLPELCAVPTATDITIKYGCLAHIPISQKHKSDSYLLNNQQFLINIEGVAKYLVAHGAEIIVDIDPLASMSEVRLFLLGSVMGGVLHQRGFLPIHGNGVEVNGQCVIFAGHSGRGKSTLAAAFARQGIRLLSDDICAIKFNQDNQLMVMPGYPHIKLWNDSLKQMGKSPKDYTSVRPNEDKYVVSIMANYCDQALPLSKIYALHFHQEADIKFQALNYFATMVALKNYTYRQRMVTRMNLSKMYYKRCAKVAQITPVIRVFRPKDFNLLDVLIKQVI